MRATTGRLIVSAIEHESVLKPARLAGAQIARVGRNGEIDVAHLSHLRRQGRAAGLRLGDAGQQRDRRHPAGGRDRGGSPRPRARWSIATRRRPWAASPSISTSSASITLTMSAHKIGGPQGVGALILGGELPVEPLVQGGGQERNRRGGTENVRGDRRLRRGSTGRGERLPMPARIAALRDALEEQAARASACRSPSSAGRRRACPTRPASPAATKTAETLVMALDLAGYRHFGGLGLLVRQGAAEPCDFSHGLRRRRRRGRPFASVWAGKTAASRHRSVHSRLGARAARGAGS